MASPDADLFVQVVQVLEKADKADQDTYANLLNELKDYGEKLRDETSKILNKFIRGDVPLLTLPDAIRKKLLANAEKASITLFNAARNEVAMLVGCNMLGPFQEWHAKQSGLPPLPVIPKGPHRFLVPPPSSEIRFALKLSCLSHDQCPQRLK